MPSLWEGVLISMSTVIFLHPISIMIIIIMIINLIYIVQFDTNGILIALESI